jgi:hypothetical protein
MGRPSLYPEHVKHRAVLLMRTKTAAQVAAELELKSIAVLYYWRRCGYGDAALANDPDRRPGPTVRCPICHKHTEVETPLDVVARRMAFVRHFTDSPECERRLRRAGGDSHQGIIDSLA